MVDTERVYRQRNNETGLTEWFFPAREGTFGPFPSQETAIQALEEFKKYCIANGKNGGRSLNNSSKTSTP